MYVKGMFFKLDYFQVLLGKLESDKHSKDSEGCGHLFDAFIFCSYSNHICIAVS